MAETETDNSKTLPATSTPPLDGGAAGTTGIEVVAVDTGGTLPAQWIAFEIWTRNRIYRLDSARICLEVEDRLSGVRQLTHELLGRRLVGGQRTLGASIWLCHPLPMPGTDAVFEQFVRGRRRYSVTSPVDRVVMQVGSIVTPPGNLEPTWDTITGAPNPTRSP
jgi:hypothetical protein